jgi:MFS family permease
MDNSGAIAGPLMAFILLALLPENYRLIFLLAGIPSVLGILVIVFKIRESKKDNQELFTHFHWKDFSARYYFFLSVVFVFTLGNSTDALLLVKANEVGVRVTLIPLVYLITNTVAVLVSVPFGIISDRIGKEKVLITGYMIYAGVYYGFGVTTGTGVIIALFALYGLYSATTDSIQKAYISDMIGSNKKGTGLGIYNALLGITLLPASLIAGILYDKVNSKVPFFFGAATAFVSAILMFVFITAGKRHH